jgi:protein-L-isoaspartate(D-aspartate) O-methyltransferase
MESRLMPSTSADEHVGHLIQELRRQGIHDERVLGALGRVPRECFIPPELRDRAWANVALPIGAGQTISQPYIVALMTQALALTGSERVLEIGTGSGYQAAILAQLAGHIWSIERHSELARQADSLLHDLGIANVTICSGDGTAGRPDAAPFDRIIVTAGAPTIPPLLLDQLSPTGGRLVIPIGSLNNQSLFLIERNGETTTRTNLGGVRFVPLLGPTAWPNDDAADRE